jgi:hypothetical protein
VKSPKPWAKAAAAAKIWHKHKKQHKNRRHSRNGGDFFYGSRVPLAACPPVGLATALADKPPVAHFLTPIPQWNGWRRYRFCGTNPGAQASWPQMAGLRRPLRAGKMPALPGTVARERRQNRQRLCIFQPLLGAVIFSFRR